MVRKIVRVTETKVRTGRVTHSPTVVVRQTTFGTGTAIPEGVSEATFPLPDCFRKELSKLKAEAIDNPAGINHQGKPEFPDALAVDDGGVPQTGRDGRATIE
jgi:hypothetical protein